MQAAAQGPLSGLQPGLAQAVVDINELLTEGADEAFLSLLGWLK